MKILYLTAIASISINAASAQFTIPQLKFDRPLFNRPVENKTILLPSTANKVHTLPLDNMPCLVTDISTLAPMPNAVPTFNNTMPNALAEQQVIPAQPAPMAYSAPQSNTDNARNLVLENIRSQLLKNKIFVAPDFLLKGK